MPGDRILIATRGETAFELPNGTTTAMVRVAAADYRLGDRLMLIDEGGETEELAQRGKTHPLGETRRAPAWVHFGVGTERVIITNLAAWEPGQRLEVWRG